MWKTIEQKNFTLVAEKEFKKKIDLTEINLKVNDKLTTIKLSDLFMDINDHEVSDDKKSLLISGWSVLHSLIGNYLVIGEEKVKITFFSEPIGEIEIAKIKNPLFILNDEKISKEDYDNFNKKIIELATPVVEQVEGAGLPHSSPSIVNEPYEKNKQRYIKSGYKEHSLGNFRLLVSEDRKPMLVELVDEVELLQYTNSTQISEGFYQFLDKIENRKINAKLIDGELTIDFLENAVVEK